MYRMNAGRIPSHAAAAMVLAAALLCALAVSSPARAAESLPKVSLAGTPTLYVAERPAPRAHAPAAWVVFRTKKRLQNPRLVVVRVAGGSGRTYRPAGAGECLRSSVVTDTGRIAVEAGRRYRVEFLVREGVGPRRPRQLITSRTLTAQRFTVPSRARGHERAPECPKAASGRRVAVKPAQLLIYAAPGRGAYIGSLLKGQTFLVRKLDPTGSWAFGYAFGSFNGLGWVKASGLAR